MKQIYIMAHAIARQRAIEAVKTAPEGYAVTISEPTRNSDQNAILHATLSEIAKQVEWCGQKFPIEIWKRLCMAAWLREKNEQPELIPALDGKGFDVIFERTSKLNKTQCSELIEWCFAFGVEHGAIFSDRGMANG